MSGSDPQAATSPALDVTLPFETLSWVGGLDGHVTMLEQTFLPLREEQLIVRTVPDMVDAIYRLAVRGAPAIGVAAGFGMVLGIAGADPAADVLKVAQETKTALDASRPTAVNLMWATAKILSLLERLAAEGHGPDALRQAAFDEAIAIYEGDRDTCRTMGRLG
ncbi:MAG: S-methyl-5-thioribose-1-phosphate isomerase, partial [Planctomycetota bacterium]